MLDKTTLSQLSQLKQAIHESKEYATGTVASTNGRFGFVRLTDGRDAFLDPEKMQFVLPGDEVKILVTTNDKKQLEATIEQLIDSPLKRFVGTYRVKGNAHFAVPDDPKVNRWIFIPPKSRKGCKEGEKIAAKIIQHPAQDGKAQAKVIERIGQPDDHHIEYKYTVAKYDLSPWNKEGEDEQLKKIRASIEAEEFGEREDYTQLPFVTIDSPTTRDMDDAVHIAEQDGKTVLTVAIADPASFIAPGSPLAKLAERQAQSTYMLGGIIPMLPESLANDCFSLVEGKKRPALVCTITLANDGAVEDYKFERAVIQSKYKLNYQQVAEFLEGTNIEGLPADAAGNISKLSELATLRYQYRTEHNLIGQDQLDYDIRLDDKGKISEIRPRSRTVAHKLVEEAMLLTNQCAGEFLAQNKLGLHTVHGGFRLDRIGEVNALLKEEQITPEGDITELEGNLQLIKALSANERQRNLIPALRRMMQSAELSDEAGPHMGMGFKHYATSTSPIRRYADLYNHWAIHSVLTGSKPYTFKPHQLERLKETLQAGRQADREIYQWLLCQYVEASLIGFEGRGKVRIVTQQGFGVRLIENGVDGFIAFPKSQEKQFDAKRMTLTVNGVTYRADCEVDVKVVSVDQEKRRIAYALVSPDAE